jgi:MSHA biogenesis protein MshJ
MTALRRLQARIDELTLRERGIMLLGILAVSYFLWDTLLMQPLYVKHKSFSAQLEVKRAEVMVLNQKMRSMLAIQEQDPDAENRKQLEALRRQLAEVEASIQVSTVQLVSPEKMPEVLRTVINKTEGLTLISLRGTGAAPILAQSDKTGTAPGRALEQAEDAATGAPETAADDGSSKVAASATISSAYKHGMTVMFEGDYLATLEYLRRLENLGFGFFWDSLEFSVKEYPRAQASIKIYTLSLNKDWISV